MSPKRTINAICLATAALVAAFLLSTAHAQAPGNLQPSVGPAGQTPKYGQAVQGMGSTGVPMPAHDYSNALSLPDYVSSVATDAAGMQLYDKPTYRIAGGPITTFATSPTDWITVTGSSTKTVRITNIMVCGITTGSSAAPASIIVQIIKRSTADSGGTSSSFTPMPEDSADAAATAAVAIYTANPTTLGTTVGNHDVYYLNLNPTGGAGCFFTDTGIRNGQALVLRGTTQQAAINFAGTTLPSGASLTYRIEETEGSTSD